MQTKTCRGRWYPIWARPVSRGKMSAMQDWRGKPDDEVFRYAVSRGLTLLTADVGFGNILRFPLGTHPGIVVTRFPNEMPTRILNQAILSALRSLSDEEVVGNLIVIEPGRMRLRRKD